MYLLAFITLIIAIVGLHAQVITLQAAKMNKAQNALAQTMVVWHRTAVRLARDTSNLPTNINGATGCVQTTAFNFTGVTLCNTAASRVSSSDLPPGYNMTYYTFPTLLFEPDTKSRYVVTFVGYKDSQGLISLPGQVAASKTLSYTIGGLLSQLANIKSVSLSYGVVNTSGTLTVIPDQATKMQDDTTVGPITILSFPIPTTIPTGSVGVISSAL